ncbi:hypothetical protein [Piscirickettsia salmonis]|uniref:hypothetical protein n=1 Tax=Piscirickettsia salmonis TaxID=1238 RepID=UPI001A912AAA|nr:hypothetical protein [Piscirickettsia salmonis]
MPDQAQVLQEVLSTGRQELTLNYQGLVRKVAVNIKPRQMVVVWVVALGHSLDVHVLSTS